MTNPIRDAIETWTADTWCQGSYDDGVGRRCLEGRLEIGFLRNPNGKIAHLIRDVLREQYGHHGGIYKWNDEPGRTFDEVLAVAEKAAVRWDEKYGS